MTILGRIRNLFRRSKARPLRPLLDGNATWEEVSKEVIVEICRHLSPADQASLALTCRWLSIILGKRSLVLEEFSRYELLKRLEKDNEFLSDILCPLCIKFHPPQSTREWNAKQGHFACINYGSKETLRLMTSSHLPSEVHFHALLSFLRSDRQHSRADGKLEQYGSQHLVNHTTYHDQQGKTRIWNIETCRAVNGQFLLKTEIVLLASEEKHGILKGVPELLELLLQNESLGLCCAHIDWKTLHPYIFLFDDSTETEVREPKSLDYHRLWTHHCFWTHGTCPVAWTGMMYYIKECRYDSWKADIARPSGCRHCATDISITKYHNDDGSMHLALTSWKNLGGGQDVEDPCWKSHLEVGRNESRTIRPRACKIGSIWKAFEAAHKDPTLREGYRPDGAELKSMHARAEEVKHEDRKGPPYFV